MHWLWVLIVGAIIGLIAGAITNKGGSMGWIANIVAGLVGSAIGQALLGSWGPQLAGMALIPSITDHRCCLTDVAECKHYLCQIKKYSLHLI
ncbi:TPA: GlsB/YeaQ/YmgE family stress response membrane protein [Enterococcus faecium]|uniref:GlsB/YeaQ/YmgE family stress response membrane protein n=3 Tax=Enterococcus faecium TaxID=1352 RepID=UPI0021A4FE64|nr:GlsB/YeaQ/YmgE family stress response membrane protein [Enterococcus faecium]